MLGEITRQPSYARLAGSKANNGGLEIPIEDLKPSDVILISSGELVPVDGRVLEGHGLVDERLIRGVYGLSRKRPDDVVLAGSTLLFGDLRVEVLQNGSQTQAAALSRATLAVTMPASSSQTLTLRGEEFAERAILPTMAIASLGFLMGDVSTAGAILRPDYATGPGLAFPLELLQAVTLCIRHGVVIRDPEAIERIATSDLLVIEHSIALERTQLELDTIEAFPGITEEKLLRFADAAFHELDDERSAVLRNLCQDRKITPLRVQPVEYAPDVTLYCGNDCIKVGDLGSRGRDTLKPNNLGHSGRVEVEPAVSLMVGINGRVAGLIHFQRSSRPEVSSTFKRLRSKRNVRIGLISNQSHRTLTPLAMSLGVDFHQGDLNTDDRIGLLKDCRQRGIKVAYISDRHVDPRIAAEAHIAISIVEGGIHSLDNDLAPICLLQPRLFNLGQLWDIAHIHQRRLKVAHRYAILPNLLCVAGAFTWGFTSLASVVVTNLGTCALYLRMATSIRALEGQIFRSLHPRCLSRESR